jgi:hypothetical protein
MIDVSGQRIVFQAVTLSFGQYWTAQIGWVSETMNGKTVFSS